MSFDTRAFRSLHCSLLGLLLCVPLTVAACGDDGGNSRALDPATGDDEPDPGEDDGAGSAQKDAGRAPKDASAIKPSSDAAVAVSQDAGAGKGDSSVAPAVDSGGPAIDHPATGADPTSASASTKGAYPVKTYTTGYPDAPEYADSTIHYPDGAEGPLAAIAIVPGFVSPQSSIQPWGPFLASHGIVAMTIGTNSPTDQPDARSTALLGALATLKGENTRDGSPLKGKLDLSRLAVGGWSMGGGGTLITVNAHPELKAALALCPWDPGATFPKISVPTIFLAAQNDTLAGGQSQGFWDSIPASTPKIVWERGGAAHQDNNDPANEKGAVGRYGLSWLKVFLEDDDRYRQFLTEKAPNASDWKSNVN